MLFHGGLPRTQWGPNAFSLLPCGQRAPGSAGRLIWGRSSYVPLPVLQKDATAWERWVYLFAQLRQLAVLAPRLPTKDPQLRGSAYEMVLHAFLLSPADHPRLLKLLETWPPHLYSLPALTQAVVQRCAPQHVQAAIDWEPTLDSSVPC